MQQGCFRLCIIFLAAKTAISAQFSDLADCDYRQRRLPDSAKPRFYGLNVTLLDVLDGHFTGNVAIEFTVLSSVTLIVIHSKNLTIPEDRVRLTAQSPAGYGDTILLNSVNECLPYDQLQISTAQPLQSGTVYRLEIAFDGILRDNMHGFYWSDYLDDKGKKQYLATTQFEETHAREAFPCFDEPVMKAVFRIQLTHSAKLLPLSNSPVKQETFDPEKGISVTQFEDTPRMSSYLVAFILSDFGRKSGKSLDGVDISVYAARHKLNQTGFALGTAISVLEYYEKFFGIKYPLKKLDLISIPDFSAGAMENWGLITFREADLLYDDVESPLTQMDIIVKVVAHEIAHQWFGNLVTMVWWDEIWLNEGFANFMMYLGGDAAHPELSEWQMLPSEAVQPGLVLDALVSTHPIVMAVEDIADIVSRFDTITYDKGAAVLLMVYEFLGEKVFRAGVRDYLNKHKYANANSDDLWSALDAAWIADGKTDNKSVKEIADGWITQSGYPLITATQQGNVITVQQEKLVPMSDTVDSSAIWFVPISMIDSSKYASSNYLLTGSNLSITIPETGVTWYKLNVGQRCFYRTNYDSANWAALTAALRLNSNVIPPEDRASLVYDAFALSRAGKLNMTVVLNLVSYFTNESHYLPWQGVKAYLDGTEGLLYETDAYLPFRRWRRQLIKPMFDRTNCMNVSAHDILKRRLCLSLFDEACNVELPSCIDQARSLYADIQKGKKVPVDMHETIYSTVLRHGNEELWDSVWTRFTNTQVASEKDLTMSALTSTENSWLIDRYLRYALDAEKVRPTDTVTILQLLSANDAARSLLWRTVRQNWDLLVSRYGWDGVMSDLLSLLQFMVADGDFKELQEFFHQPGRKLGSGGPALNRTIETIELRRKYLDLYYTEIKDWVANQTNYEY